MKKLIAFLLATALSTSPALAQTSPNLTFGQVLTPGQWNAILAGKQDVLGFTPMNVNGGVFLGRVTTAPPGATTAGLNLTPGTTPGSPVNGDLWVTSAGLFGQINGATVGPLISVATPCTLCGLTTNPLSQFAATTSAQLRGIISDETGTGAAVFGTSPTIASPTFSGTFAGTYTIAGTPTLSGTFAGTPSFSGANFVTLGNLVQDATAWSLLGNASGITANYAPFTIGGLTAKTTPAGSDLIMISDQAASGALKFSTLTQAIGALASGVSAIDTKTGNFTTGNGIDSTAGNIIELTAARRTLPTVQTFTSGTGLTYTTPANALFLEISACGGGGGGAGAGAGNTTVAGTAGNTTTFNAINAAGGGAAGATAALGSSLGGVGGTGGTGTATRRMAGSPGDGGLSQSTITSYSRTGFGGGSALLGGGAQGVNAPGAGNAGVANSGGGGSGAQNSPSAANLGAGGGGGECFYLIINNPSATFTYTVGASAAGGVSTNNGGAGAAGFIQVIEHYNS
jgi:hypothetical protein